VAQVRVRQKELEDAGYGPEHASVIAYLTARRERALTGKVVIKPSDRRWVADRMGAGALFYLDHCYDDSAVEDWRVFTHDIQTQSGKHVHQGGLVLFVLDGKGVTTYDGVRHEWEKGDLILLPIKPNGVEHQHFNLEGRAKWIAFWYRPVMDALATEWRLTEDRKGWREQPPIGS